MFDVEKHDSATYVQLLRTLHEARSAIDALEARSVDALSGATRREQIEAAGTIPPTSSTRRSCWKIEKQADLLSRTEITLATRRAPHAASAALTRSRRIVRDMPHMLRALATGKVTAEIVHETARSLGPLEHVDRRAVDRVLDERLPDLDAAGTTLEARRHRRHPVASIPTEPAVVISVPPVTAMSRSLRSTTGWHR